MGERIIFLMILVCLFCLNSFAQDSVVTSNNSEYSIVVGAGYFSPVDGEGGISVIAGLYYNELAANTVLGSEFIFSKYKSPLFGYQKVGMTGFDVSVSIKHYFKTNEINPYIGANLLIGFHTINEKDTPGITYKSKVAGSYGLGGIIGVSMAVNSNINAFVECRYSANGIKTNYNGVSDFTNHGGLNIFGGVSIGL